jgi:hypothetical protein
MQPRMLREGCPGAGGLQHTMTKCCGRCQAWLERGSLHHCSSSSDDGVRVSSGIDSEQRGTVSCGS